MQESDLENAFPLDISCKIVSSLEVLDVCALGSCSRYCKELCGSDSIWKSLTEDRWPLLASSSLDPIIKSWKEIYAQMHRKMQCKAKAVTQFVEKCSSPGTLDIGDYYRAIEDLRLAQLSFKDVQMFLFKTHLSVLLNLVGLHYCIICLNEPAGKVMDALVSARISGRHLCVNWLTLGRWFFGFQMRDEPHSCWVSLADVIATDNGEEVLGVLHRGVTDDLLRIDISTSYATSDHCSCHGRRNQE